MSSAERGLPGVVVELDATVTGAVAVAAAEAPFDGDPAVAVALVHAADADADNNGTRRSSRGRNREERRGRVGMAGRARMNMKRAVVKLSSTVAAHRFVFDGLEVPVRIPGCGPNGEARRSDRREGAGRRFASPRSMTSSAALLRTASWEIRDLESVSRDRTVFVQRSRSRAGASERSSLFGVRTHLRIRARAGSAWRTLRSGRVCRDKLELSRGWADRPRAG